MTVTVPKLWRLRLSGRFGLAAGWSRKQGSSRQMRIFHFLLKTMAALALLLPAVASAQLMSSGELHVPASLVAETDHPAPGQTGTIAFTMKPQAEIASAPCRERVCQYVSIPVVAVTLKKKRKPNIH